MNLGLFLSLFICSCASMCVLFVSALLQFSFSFLCCCVESNFLGLSHVLFLLIFFSLFCSRCVKNGNTALLYAAEKRKAELVKVLLERGANVDVMNKVDISLSLLSCVFVCVAVGFDNVFDFVDCCVLFRMGTQHCYLQLRKDLWN